MAGGNYEVIKIEIVPMYDASGGSQPVGVIIVKTVKR
jgi:hypothetical protein